VIADTLGAQGEAWLIEGDAAGRRHCCFAISDEVCGVFHRPCAASVHTAREKGINALGRLGLSKRVMPAALVELALRETDQDSRPPSNVQTPLLAGQP
jgi:hypothetical protein